MSPRSRLLRNQGLIAAGFSVLVGVFLPLQLGLGLAKFGGHEYIMRVSMLSAVRVEGPGVSVAASLYALIISTHELDPEAIRPRIVGAARWTLALVVGSLPSVVALVLVLGALVCHFGFHVPWGVVWSSHRVLESSDLLACVSGLFEGLAVCAAFCWFALPFMGRRSWSLLRKLGVTWGAFALFHVLGGVLSPLRSQSGVVICVVARQRAVALWRALNQRRASKKSKKKMSESPLR